MSWQSKDTQRKSNTAPLKEVFEELLETYRLKNRFDETRVVAEWGELMGKTVASRTSNLYVRHKILYVQLQSGPVKKELMMNKLKVINLISQRFGDQVILDVVFL